MAKYIFTERQLKEAVEGQLTPFGVTGNTPTEMVANAKKEAQKIANSGFNKNNAKIVMKTATNNTPDDQETNVEIQDPNNADEVIRNYQNLGGDIDKTSFGMKLGENVKTYTKKQIKEARKRSVMEGCTVMTKREMEESIRR